ncbi:MAG: hypothetical protein JXA11_09040 [Phycisphaerae bacterium]|nr:hypothetical protein [Phycisphaerae bacterium]
MKNGIQTGLWILMLIALPMVLLAGLWREPLSAGEDDILYYYPLRVQAGEALSRGDWPMTDSLTAGGMAVLGDPQSAVLFPTTWLFAVLSGRLAYSLSIFVAFATAGVGMWLYLRRVGLSRPAAGFGSIAFILGGFFVAHRVHLSMIQTAAFFPWGLWCFELLRKNCGLRNAECGLKDIHDGASLDNPHSAIRKPQFFQAFLAMVPVFSLTVLAGHWPAMIQMSLVWGAYFLFRVRPLGWGLLTTALAGVLVVGITAPQWSATLDVMRQATRAKIPYAVAGENSYFPVSAMLWLFPFLFGSRWPNLYPQKWWGPWHLCETLGYVGLITLVLAIATAWRFQRRAKNQSAIPMGQVRNPQSAITRTWSWLCVGTFVFMLGYYVPTYWLIYKLPVLGIVRCPSRMILALGCGLATLAAVGVHLLITGEEPARELGLSVRRACRRRLPIVMIALLIGLAVSAILLGWIWPDAYPWPMNGSWRDVIRAVLPYSPAVWIPLVLVVLTSTSVWYWLRNPARNWPMLIALLVVDLATVAPFVDAPSSRGPGPSDPEISPAADWLRKHAPNDEFYRVWGLGDPYGRRQAELLLPRTNVIQKIPSISTYGPFQTAGHVEVLGFKIYGTNSDWRGLLRRPDQLADYHVRYILAEAESQYDQYLREAESNLKLPYSPVASLPAVYPDDPDIRIYENVYQIPASAPAKTPPQIGFTAGAHRPGWWLARGTLPAAGGYVLALTGGIVVRLRRNFRKTSRRAAG